MRGWKYLPKVHTHQFDLRKYSGGENLLSRKQGQRILEAIKKELNKLPLGGVLLLDFQNIRYATPACLVEFLIVFNGTSNASAKAPMQREFHDKYLILKLESANYDLKDSLDFVLKERNSAVPSLDENGNRKVLGELTKARKDTLEIVRESGGVTSTEISRLFNIPINAASNRLRDLYNMKLVKREERILTSTGGRQFVYRCIL
jgi:DNA-binding transcriptional ArsR family regulator